MAGPRENHGRTAGRIAVSAVLVAGSVIGFLGPAAPAFADPAEPASLFTQSGSNSDTLEATGLSGALDGSDSEVSISSSKRFTIHNYSSHPLRLGSVGGDQKFEGRPDVGAVLEPGDDHIIEVTHVYGTTQRDDFNYEVLGDNGSVVGLFTAVTVLGSDGFYLHPSTGAGCTIGVCDRTVDSVTFKDAANSRVQVAADSTEAAKLLSRFCTGETPNLCSFTLTSPVDDQAWSILRLGGSPVWNNTNNSGNWVEYRVDETRSVTNNLAVTGSAELQITKIVKLGVSSTFSRQWTDTKSWGQTKHLAMEPYSKNWVDVSYPEIRFRGDFEIKLGNTTWVISNATYAVPDGNSWREPSYIIQGRSMTDQEKRDLAPTVLSVPEG